MTHGRWRSAALGGIGKAHSGPCSTWYSPGCAIRYKVWPSQVQARLRKWGRFESALSSRILGLLPNQSHFDSESYCQWNLALFPNPLTVLVCENWEPSGTVMNLHYPLASRVASNCYHRWGLQPPVVPKHWGQTTCFSYSRTWIIWSSYGLIL